MKLINTPIKYSALIMTFFTTIAFAAEHYSLGVGHFRTYIQYNLNIPGASFYVKDTLINSQKYNGYTVYTNINSVYNVVGLEKRKATPVSYWYERKDTVLATDILEDVGINDKEDIIYIPRSVPNIDSVEIISGTDSGKVKYLIYDNAPKVTTTHAVFNNCTRLHNLLKSKNGNIDTISISYYAPSIGLILSTTKTGETMCEIVNYLVDIGPMPIKYKGKSVTNSNITYHLPNKTIMFNLLGQKTGFEFKSQTGSGIYLSPTVNNTILLQGQ